jgi:chromate transporter
MFVGDQEKGTSTASAAASAPDVGTATIACSLGHFLWYFLRLGTFGFGGPIALAGYMQRDLVEERRWISKQDYVEGLAFAQLCPGPLAAHYRRFAQNRQVRAFVQGVTAAATGAIAGAAYILSRHAIRDVPAVLIALVTLILLLKVKKLPEPLVILTAGIVGVILMR